MTAQDEPKRTPSADALWRAEYRQRHYEQRIATVQADLFGAPTIEVFRRNTAQKPPARTVRNLRPRPALTRDELAALLASAANWHRVGKRARISTDSPSQYAGREGVIWRLCSPVFADHVYLFLDLVGQESSEKRAFVELRDVEPITE
jgi:hypothetical protein